MIWPSDPSEPSAEVQQAVDRACCPQWCSLPGDSVGGGGVHNGSNVSKGWGKAGKTHHNNGDTIYYCYFTAEGTIHKICIQGVFLHNMYVLVCTVNSC